MKKLLLVSVLFTSLSGLALADTTEHAHENEIVKSADVTSSIVTTPAGKEYAEAMNKMHDPMMAVVNEKDPDVAFAKGMIPHHQGAIEMAKIELKYGKDPEMRKLAEAVIKAQDGEIKMMNDWLAAHEKKAK
ncbi:MAG: DUF305 domain-containing protein [Enterobacteriaceae bacterium]|jgi:uncharacterized protein (DUF305 family)|nr:DUF305 domain-containing protein [Enterobacteriaceae bacterium]